MQVEAVVFDIGNVLIEWHPRRYFDRVLGARQSAAFFAAVDIDAMMTRIDAGAPFFDTIAATARAHPDWAPALAHFRDNWADLASPEIPGSVQVLQALRARGVPVFALSNFGAENFALSAARHPFLASFDRRYISARLRQAKPAPAIYETLERDSGVPPGALLFTDDRPENIATARARGWQTHLFDGPEGWAHCLLAAGLLTEEDVA
jgi:2-haloacid dehalogenase